MHSPYLVHSRLATALLHRGMPTTTPQRAAAQLRQQPSLCYVYAALQKCSPGFRNVLERMQTEGISPTQGRCGVSEQLFRCDYCGTLADIDDAVVFWTEIDRLDDDRVLNLPAVYCGPFCGRTATRSTGSGRG